MTQARAEFARSLALLAVSLGFELDEPMVGVYWHALRAVPSDVRHAAFAAAVDRKWYRFPQPGELKQLAAGALSAKRKEAAALHLESCGHSGHWQEDARGRLTRCACWMRAMRAMADVGQPLALPAAADDVEA